MRGDDPYQGWMYSYTPKEAAMVRRAVESDFEAMHRLLEQLMPAEHDRRGTWRDALGRAGYAAWVAEEDGTPAGFIDLFVFPDVGHGRTVGLVNNLVVDAGFRGRGLGESLLREVVHHCKQLNVVELHVWTGHDNTPAISLYKKLGFADRAVLLELQM